MKIRINYNMVDNVRGHVYPETTIVDVIDNDINMTVDMFMIDMFGDLDIEVVDVVAID